MKIFCSQCGEPATVEPSDTEQSFTCPACGAKNFLSAPPPVAGYQLAPESERTLWQQRRRRTTIVIAGCIVCLLVFLVWLVLHPSAPTSPARKLKHAVFGNRVTDAVEQAAAGRDSGGTADTNPDAGTGTSPTARTHNEQGTADQASGGNRHPRHAATDSLPNPHHPYQVAPHLPAPPERSIGWLDRFFGINPATRPTQAGEGGRDLRQPTAGNTNTIAARETNEPVAAEISQAQPLPPQPVEENTPVEPSNRTTNISAPRAAMLNDNMERLLRQHRAGSGDVRISLMWRNRNDLDLHVVDPGGEEIYFQHRRSGSGGLLDIDMNASLPLRSPAVENVFWPVRTAPHGTYKIFVNHYRRHEAADETPFTVRVLIRGRTTDFPGLARFGTAKTLVHQFTLDR